LAKETIGRDSSTDDSIGSNDYCVKVTSVYTPDEMLREGLWLAGFDEETQKKQPKSNLRDFEDQYGSSPTVLSIIWSDLQKTTNPEAYVPENKRELKYYLMAHHFLKQYPTKSERKAAYNQQVKQTHTQRDWVWYFVDHICALQQEKIYIPNSHLEGEDIWIMTVDGTMSASNEIAGEEKVKDPSMFSFKHHSAGFNAEVGVSILESRCVWINGPEPAGDKTDLVYNSRNLVGWQRNYYSMVRNVLEMEGTLVSL
jgi:hypothetical protein